MRRNDDPAVPVGLTRLQRDTLLVIQELSADGVAPSITEIAAALSCGSRSLVHGVLGRLRDRGYIAWRRAEARSITVLRALPMPEEPAIVGFFHDPALVARVAEELAA